MGADTSVLKKKHEMKSNSRWRRGNGKHLDMEGEGEKAMDTNTIDSPGDHNQPK